jgi:hypothetical protein
MTFFFFFLLLLLPLKMQLVKVLKLFQHLGDPTWWQIVI